jgi:diguanylate cyclase (GGDEF)-like protein
MLCAHGSTCGELSEGRSATSGRSQEANVLITLAGQDPCISRANITTLATISAVATGDSSEWGAKVRYSRQPCLVVGGTEVAFGIIGLLLGLFVQIPQQTRLAVWLIALIVTSLGAATILLAPRVPGDWGVDISLALAGGLIASSAFFMTTAQGQMSEGMLVLSIAVLAATIRPATRVVALLALLLAIYTAAWLANPVISGAFNFALVNTLIVGISAVVLRMAHRLRKLAQHDPLTGVLNRRGLDAIAHRHPLAATPRFERTLLVMDLDDFKGYNDRHGHAAGDVRLVELATAWRACLSRTDALARIGGDEFAILLRSAGTEETGCLIERLRMAHPAGWSYGRATWRAGDDFDAALTRADRAMYEAKHPDALGGNSYPPPAIDHSGNR